MEETPQQERQELEFKNPSEDQGGIGRRLRDRDLLKKRKAEAEAKETNQLESQRKRPRAENKSGAKRRGRPRKTEPNQGISVVQGEAAAPQEAASAVLEPAEVFFDQTSGSLESQTASLAPLPVFGSLQNPIFAPTLTSPAPVNQTPPLIPPSLLAPAPIEVIDTTPIPVRDLAPAEAPAEAPEVVSVPVPDPAPAPTKDPVPTVAPAPSAPPLQVENLYVETQGKEALNQVVIEDLGPDEEEDIPPSQEKGADEDLNGAPSFNTMFSVPTMSSQPPPQEYVPGNSL